MRLLLMAIMCLSLFFSKGQAPTKANVEAALRSSWDRPASSSSPKQDITINSIKIGTGAKANLQDKIDGIPDNAMVTIVQIDFTVREYYNPNQLTHRVMRAKVYKDQFDEWAAKNIGMKVIPN